MLSIAHAVTGAYIAANLPNIWLFAPIALASHFVLDHIKHFDVGTGMRNSSRKMLYTLMLAALDLLIGAVLIAIFWRQTPSHFTWYIWTGAFFGILPDLLESTQTFFKKPIKILQPLYSLHNKVHYSTKNIFWGLLPQILLICLIGLLTILSW